MIKPRQPVSQSKPTQQAKASASASSGSVPAKFVMKTKGEDGKLVTLTRLWENTSKAGNVYYRGSILQDDGSKQEILLYNYEERES